jgi:hypothetical protein
MLCAPEECIGTVVECDRLIWKYYHRRVAKIQEAASGSQIHSLVD